MAIIALSVDPSDIIVMIHVYMYKTVKYTEHTLTHRVHYKLLVRMCTYKCTCAHYSSNTDSTSDTVQYTNESSHYKH